MINRKIAASVALALGVSFTGASYAASPFAGFYAGGQLGYSVYDIKATATDTSIPETGTIEGLSGSGAEGGLYAGWGMDIAPTAYAGLEIEYSWSGAEHTTSFSDPTGSGTARIEDKDNYGISARLGWLPSSNTMLYARAGWQRVSLEYSGDLSGLGAGPASGSTDVDHDGFRFGLGAEVAMASNWLMRLDYAHTWYQEEDIASSGTASAKSEPDNDVFRIGIAYRF